MFAITVVALYPLLLLLLLLPLVMSLIHNSQCDRQLVFNLPPFYWSLYAYYQESIMRRSISVMYKLYGYAYYSVQLIMEC